MQSNRAASIGYDLVAETPDRLDEVVGQLLAQAADEHFYRIGIPVEILIVEVFGQLGPRDDLALVQHEIGEEAKFVGGELDGLPIDGDAPRLHIEPDRPGGD